MIERRGEFGALTRAKRAEAKARKEEDVRDPETVHIKAPLARDIGLTQEKRTTSWTEDFRGADGKIDLIKLRGVLADKLKNGDSFADIPKNDRAAVRAELVDMAHDFEKDDNGDDKKIMEFMFIDRNVIERAVDEIDENNEAVLVQDELAQNGLERDELEQSEESAIKVEEIKRKLRASKGTTESTDDQETVMLTPKKAREIAGLMDNDRPADLGPLPYVEKMPEPENNDDAKIEMINRALGTDVWEKQARAVDDLPTFEGSLTDNEINEEIRAEKLTTEILGVDGADVDYLLVHAKDLGLPDLHFRDVRELGRALQLFEKQQERMNELKKEGFLNRWFGKAAREMAQLRVENRILQDQFDRIQQLAVDNRGIAPNNKQAQVGSISKRSTAYARGLERSKINLNKRKRVVGDVN